MRETRVLGLAMTACLMLSSFALAQPESEVRYGARSSTMPTTSPSAQQDSEADQEQRKTAAKIGGVLLAAGLTLAVIDAKTEHRGITLASGACFVGVAAATLWEIKLKREQHSLAVGPRAVQFRLRW